MAKPLQEGECRFCLETDSIDQLIAPCLCKGSAKYVHNRCLVQWISTKSTINTTCSSCLEEYTRAFPTGYELYPPFFTLNIPYGTAPIACIYINHWCYFMVAGLIIPFSARIYVYCMLQGVVHGIYSLKFLEYYTMLHNKQYYQSLWLKNDRLVLPILHFILILMIPYTQWVSGMGANMCLYLYVYEHYYILDDINKEYKIRFTNR